ncbi:MAG: phosphoglucosamine mutase [Lachnospiraceae bacterium]|nr:phosphoglucosamine mutase [Lachnospiraceae bacterium]MDY2956900.1 phosphoglucosamine mutase [Lachnospiraceae bacterium]
MGKYFGTDGFRGEANVTLTVEHAYKVGRFLGWYFGKDKPDQKAHIVIGKDTRRSSYMFEYALVSGLVASGADAYLLHVTTTPSVSYIARVDSFDCGIMISASHNPYYDNGIKLINSDGEKMSEDVIGEIEKYIDGEISIPFANKEHIGKTVDYINGRNRYMGYLIGLAEYSFKGIKVGIDAANGSAWSLAKAVFDALGAHTYVINAEPNGLNINENSGSTHMEALQKLVVDEGLDIGFAFDGDADRCLAVDEKGNILTGDHIIYMYAKHMKARGILKDNTVVCTVMSNFGFLKAMEAEGIDCVVTDVGDKNVYAAMAKNGYRLGGEQSGHIILSKFATTGDGLITAIKLMEVMISSKKSVGSLASGMKEYPQVLINVKVDDKDAAMKNEEVLEEIKKTEKILGKEGRVLVRKSGTEPVVRVMVEAKDDRTCREEAEHLADFIKDKCN